MKFKQLTFSFMLKMRIISLVFFVLFSNIIALEIELLSPDPDPDFPIGDTLLDIKDYDNEALILTQNEILKPGYIYYNRLEPSYFANYMVSDSSGYTFPKNTVFAAYEGIYNYILAGCSDKFLISYFPNHSSGGNLKGIYKGNINLNGNEICSISFLNEFVFLVVTNTNNNNKIDFYKSTINEDSYNQELTGSTPLKFDISLEFIENFRYFSCEAISVKDDWTDDILVCGFVYKTSENKYKYTARVPNTDFNGLDTETTILESESLINFKIQKINTTYARFLVENNSFEIYVTKISNKYTVNIASEDLRDKNLYSYYSYGDLFYYNNNYIFHAIPTDDTYSAFKLYLSNQKKNNIYLITIEKKIKKIQGYQQNGYFLYVFQCEGQSGDQIYYLVGDSSDLECKKAWYINDEENKVCLEQDYCPSNEYYYHIDTKECKIGNCGEDYYKFNFECYKEDNFPENIQIVSEDESELKLCESTLDFCYINTNDFKTHCSNEPFEDYSLKYENTKTYFSNCVDSLILFNTETYLFNDQCLINCPENTEKNEEKKICECKYKYYISDDGKLNCFGSDIKCEDTEYPIESNTNQCFKSKESCIENNNKFFNNKCYISSCPDNANDNDDDGICECTYLYYLDSELFSCLENSATCELKIGNECFHSLDDCADKNKVIYNKQCYDECPTNTEDYTIIEENKVICKCKYNYYYNIRNELYTCLSENEECETKRYNYQSPDGKQCFNDLTDCKENGKKIFNNICYDNCPTNTEENIDDGICYCKYNYYYNTVLEKYTCLNENEECESYSEYKYKSSDGKICYKNKEECSEKIIFNNICYDSCPINSEEIEGDNGKTCKCLYLYYLDNGIYTCLGNDETSDIKIGNECFHSLDDCVEKNKKIFNKQCYDECPIDTNTEEDENEENKGICKCKYNYYFDSESELFTCLAEDEECDSKEYKYKSESGKICYKASEECTTKGKKIFNNICYDNECPDNSNSDDNDNDGICQCSYNYYYDLQTKKYICLGNGETCESKGYNYESENGKQCYKDTEECVGKKIINNKCYDDCPANSEFDNEQGICKCSYNYYHDLSSDEYTCFGEEEGCNIKGYNFEDLNGKECFNSLEDCKSKGKYIYNKQCYTLCPANTQLNTDAQECYCKFSYYYDNENDLYTCLAENEECENIIEYKYKSQDGKICYKNEEECSDKKIFNNICYENCPANTVEEEDGRFCHCSYNYYYDLDSKEYICLNNGESCESKNYDHEDMDGKECFISLEDCKTKGKKIFNKQCYTLCPSNTIMKTTDNQICICNNFYTEDNGIYNCFDSDKTCKEENTEYDYTNIQTKECFKTKPECINKNGNDDICQYYLDCDPSQNFMFNGVCYKDGCPEGAIITPTSSNNCICKDDYIIDNDRNICIKNEEIEPQGCEEGFYPREDFSENDCVKDPDGYYLDNNIYKKCYESCKNCINKGDENDHKCIACNSPYTVKIINKNKNNNCYQECPYYYYIDNDDKYKCTEDYSCPKEFPKLLSEFKECIKEESIEEEIKFISCSSLNEGNSEDNSNYNESELNKKCHENIVNDIENYIKDIVNTLQENKKNDNSENANIKKAEIDFKGEGNYAYRISPTDESGGVSGPKLYGINNKPSFSEIDLGDCEITLREKYELDHTVSLIILTKEIISGTSSERDTQIEVFDSKNYRKLNLSLCDEEESKISIYTPILIPDEIQRLYEELSSQGYDIFNINDRFYTDICTPFTSSHNTDMTLSDRINYIYNSLDLQCQSGCKFSGINKETRVINCTCSASENEINYEDQIIERKGIDSLYKSFVDTLKYSNYKVLFCYKLAFNVEIFSYNIGTYLTFAYFSLYFICVIFFMIKGIKEFKKHIHNFVHNHKNNNDTLNNIETIHNKQTIVPNNNLNSENDAINERKKTKKITKKKSTRRKTKTTRVAPHFPPRKKSFRKRSTHIEGDNFFKEEKIYNNKPKEKRHINQRETSKGLNYNSQQKNNIEKQYDNYELNDMEYDEAIIHDKRSFFSIYWATLKREHILIFSLFTRNDYNILYVKFTRMIFLICTDMCVNVFFFSDETMHKAYLDYGKYNFIQQIPQIVYSTIVAQILEIFLCFLSLTDKHYYEIKQLGPHKKHEIRKIYQCSKNKIIIFYTFTFIVFAFHWYAVTCFCAVYRNTQGAFIKDSILSFVLSLLDPFLIYLIPTILRIISLRICIGKLEFVYKLSDIIPFF